MKKLRKNRTLSSMKSNRYMKCLATFLSTLVIVSAAMAQESNPAEKFELSFTKKKDTRGQFQFKSSGHTITIEFDADEIQTTQNANFVIVNKQIIQAGIKPIKDNTSDFENLSADMQKSLLSKYVDGEMDYVNNELKLYSRNLKKEWITLKSRLWLVWSFDIENLKADEPASLRLKKQIYASTVCYNQIIDLNTPIMQSTDPADARKLLNKIMPGIRLDNKR